VTVGPPPTLLSARGLAARAGGRVLFESLDLDRVGGTVTVVTGPNGSGKSTLLKVLVGLQRPSRGRVERATRATVGYVPQLEPGDPGLPFPAATVVAQGLPRGRAARAALGPRADAVTGALARAGYAAPPSRRYTVLSGGERRRVLLARALVGRPALLVLDEPTAGVDAAGERDVVALVQEARERGAAVVWVCHALPAVEASADRVVRLGSGAP
jgi:zinc transport system ATP-binding protein